VYILCDLNCFCFVLGPAGEMLLWLRLDFIYYRLNLQKCGRLFDAVYDVRFVRVQFDLERFETDNRRNVK